MSAAAFSALSGGSIGSVSAVACAMPCFNAGNASCSAPPSSSRNRCQQQRTLIDSCCPTEYWFSDASRLTNVRVWLSGFRPASTMLVSSDDALQHILGHHDLHALLDCVELRKTAHGLVARQRTRTLSRRPCARHRPRLRPRRWRAQTARQPHAACVPPDRSG